MDQLIIDFIEKGIKNGQIAALDRIYIMNQLGMISHCTELNGNLVPSTVLLSQLELLDGIIGGMIEKGIIDETLADREISEAQIMNLLTPLPSVVNHEFHRYYQKSPELATNYFYRLSQENNYIKTREIAKNSHFSVPTKYGELEITINLSKPEKDPKQIILEKSALQANYPKCLLCMENEGYQGRVNHPARSNHRIVRLSLNDERWGLQYSPYAYYSEHCIFLSEEHRPMKIQQATFRKLLAIVKEFPHYFAGSNADLPIVGGSILAHDHYQGGRHTFAMAQAPIMEHFKLKEFPEISMGIVKWPMSVIRLSGKDVSELELAATHVLKKWEDYSDQAVGILANDEDGTPHNTITPIARKNGAYFELDLVLRNNSRTDDYPDGIFHPHQDVQHIKKENIGLIEVMGLAILPPRLKNELQEVEDFLLGKVTKVAEYHQSWAEKLKNKERMITPENVHEIVEQAVGKVFLRVLEDAGVYKQNDIGLAAFKKFIMYANQK